MNDLSLSVLDDIERASYEIASLIVISEKLCVVRDLEKGWTGVFLSVSNNQPAQA